jgi:hypothetical protein
MAETVPVYGPNGLVVNVPKGTPPEKVKEIMDDIMAKSEKPTSSFMKDVVGRGFVGQGVLMGGGDEAEAYIRSMLPGGKPYEEELTGIREQIKRTEKERPIASTTAEVAGSLAPALAAAFATPFTGGAAAPAAAASAARVGSLAGNIFRGAGMGAAVGGAQGATEGFLKGEGGFEPRAERAVSEGLIGGAVGGTLGAAVPVAKSAFGSVFGSPTVRAQERVLGILEQEGLTPAEVATEYARRQAQNVKPEIIADIYPGSAVASESRRVLNVPGAPRGELAGQLVERMEGQGARIQDAFAKSVGTDKKFFPVIDDLEKTRKVDATPLYQAAYIKPARTSEIDNLILRAPDDAFTEAKQAARYEGLIFPNLVAQNKEGVRTVVGDYTVKDVDLLKRGLDRIIERETNDITGKVSSEGRRAAGLKSEIVSKVDVLAPEYAEARAKWAGPSAVMDAMRSGQRIFNERAEITAKDIAKLGPSEKEGFLIGAFDAVSQRIGRKIEGQDVTGAFRSGNAKAQLEAALTATGKKPDEVAAITNALFSDIEREAAIANTNRQLRAISQTAPLQAEDAAFREGGRAIPGILGDLQRSGVGGAVGGLLQRAATRLSTGLTEQGTQRTNAEISRLLFPATEQGVKGSMDELMMRSIQRGKYAPQRGVMPGLLADPLTDLVVPNR